MERKPGVLLILDGWGYRFDPTANATRLSRTPNFDRLLRENPWTLLDCMGVAVGLSPGQMGNSEVGHLNIGAGRRVVQPLAQLDQMVSRGEFLRHPAIVGAMEGVIRAGTQLHLTGLLSDGGVHSHISHLFALIDVAAKLGVQKLVVHAILDGRDTSPYSGKGFLHGLLRKLAEYPYDAKLATVSGRYYAMDRDKRWERVEPAYRAIVQGQGSTTNDPIGYLGMSHERGETDEFVKPYCVVDKVDGQPLQMKPDDAVIFYNFREDRAREISSALYLDDFNAFQRPFTIKHFVTFSRYSAEFNNPVVLEEHELRNTITEYLSDRGQCVCKVAETEKYAHVTYFFNGGREEPFKNERRVLIPSPKVATYDLKPEMSVMGVTNTAVDMINSGTCFFTVINFANGDMVGHTGNLDAAVKAVEAVDRSLGRILDAVDYGKKAYLIVTADHGNCERERDSAGNIYTAHTLNPVPLVVVGTSRKLKCSYSEAPEDVFADTRGQALRDIIPTFLDLWSMEQPAEMDGHSLLEN
jgi:2,3-bisphosphoglycerate-independent phosphoglycerate mutase